METYKIKNITGHLKNIAKVEYNYDIQNFQSVLLSYRDKNSSEFVDAGE